jgi:Fe-S-cluster containining protein
MSQPAPWYAAGLRFGCTQCGKCCTGGDGFVWLGAVEMAELAVFLGLSLDAFVERYIWQVDDEFVLGKRSGSEDCVFLAGKGCRVYPVRPLQCRSFPFWSRNLESEASWNAAAASCDGISVAAPLVPLEQIEQELRSRES